MMSIGTTIGDKSTLQASKTHLTQQTSVYTPVDIHPAVSTASERPRGLVIRTIIADDERLAREKLRIFLASEPGLLVVAECSNGEETVAAVQQRRAHLVILDVQLPGPD